MSTFKEICTRDHQPIKVVTKIITPIIWKIGNIYPRLKILVEAGSLSLLLLMFILLLKHEQNNFVVKSLSYETHSFINKPFHNL